MPRPPLRAGEPEPDRVQSPFLLLLVDELMAASRVETTARHGGYAVRHARTTDEFWRGVAERPALVLLGTHHTRLPWEVLLRQLKGWPDPPPVLAFGSHMDAGTRARARRAGVTRWVANSRLVEALPQLIAEVGRWEAPEAATSPRVESTG